MMRQWTWTTLLHLIETRHIKDVLDDQGEMKPVNPLNLAIREGLLNPPRERERERDEQQRRS